HLKKPSVHQGRGQALIVLTMIRVLAFTLTLVFFHRQVRSHLRSCCIGFCDLAQRLAYQFVVTAQRDSSLFPAKIMETLRAFLSGCMASLSFSSPKGSAEALPEVFSPLQNLPAPSHTAYICRIRRLPTL